MISDTKNKIKQYILYFLSLYTILTIMFVPTSSYIWAPVPIFMLTFILYIFNFSDKQVK